MLLCARLQAAYLRLEFKLLEIKTYRVFSNGFADNSESVVPNLAAASIRRVLKPIQPHGSDMMVPARTRGSDTTLGPSDMSIVDASVTLGNDLVVRS